LKITKTLIDRMLKFLFFVALIALILTPVLPWITQGEDHEENHLWITKAEISQSENETISMVNRNINYTSIGFLLGIVFTLTGRVGVQMRKIERNLMANYFMFSSVPLLISSVVSMIFSIRVIMMINGLGGDYNLGYNYSHLLMSIPFLFVSILFAAIVIPRAKKGIEEIKMEESKKLPQNQFSQDDTTAQMNQAEHPPSTIICKNCRGEINRDALVCPSCGIDVSVRCPECENIYPEHLHSCPRCGDKREILK